MGELGDLVFTLLGKLGRWLNVRGNRVCFVVWTLCLAYWTVRNIQLGLVVQSLGCIFSMGFNLYGFWNWKDKGIGK